MDERKEVRFSTALTRIETESHVMSILVDAGFIPQSRFMDPEDLARSQPENRGEVLLIDNEFLAKDSRIHQDLVRKYELVIEIADLLPEKSALLQKIQELAWGSTFQGSLPSLGAKRSKLILVASQSSGVGVTTIAHNLAIEVAAMSHQTLLIDADFRFASLSALMDIHDLYNNADGRRVNATLRALDLSVGNIEIMYKSINTEVQHNDYIIIDCGSISRYSDISSDRRREATIMRWLLAHADLLLISSTPRELDCHRLDSFLKDLKTSTCEVPLRIIRNMSKTRGSRKASPEDAHFDIAQTRLPLDARNMIRCESAGRSLRELQLRSPLQNALEQLAGELVR